MKDKLDKLPIVNSLQSLEQRVIAMFEKLAYCLLMGAPLLYMMRVCKSDTK